MKGLIAVGTLVALAAMAGSAHAQGGFAPPELATVKVRDNIYMIRSGASGNITVLLSDEGAVLVDDKFAMDHDGVMTKLREITDKPVLYVINTHLHADHTGGNAAMQALSAKFIAHENARRTMAETLDTGLPNITLEEHLRLYHGEFVLDVYYLGRGHTDGDVVVHLPKQRMVLMGDLFATWEPYVHLIHYAAGGSLREWSRTLERALALDFDAVIPGHSGITDRAHLETYLATTLRMQEMIREMNRADRSREDIQKMLETEFGWSGFVTTLGLDGAIGEMQ
jgi:glyoxylase-like metal-dependent hydrolase (beta-lactamase superfamily II)